MKICFLTEEFPGLNDGGGIGFHFYGLASELTKRGHQVSVVYNGPRRLVKAKIEIVGVWSSLGKFAQNLIEWLQKFELLNVLLWNWGALQTVRELEKRGRFDLIEAPEYHATPILWGVGRQKLVLSFHGGKTQTSGLNGEDQYLPNRLLGYWEKVTAQGVSHSYAVSHLQKKVTEKLFGIKVEQVLPNSVDTNFFVPATINQFPKTKQTKPFFLFVGRMELRKGIVPLIEGYAELLSKKPAQYWPDLLCLGEDFYQLGPEKNLSLTEYIKQFLPPAVAKKIHYLDRVSQSELLSYYQQAEACFFPSLEEPFGNVIVEAMACGAVVVVGKNNGVADFLTKSSLISIPVTAHSVGRTMNWLVTKMKPNQKILISKLNRQLSLEKFSSAQVASLTEDYFSFIVNKMKNIYLVIPTIRTLNFLEAWGNEFESVNIIVVEDSPKKTVKIPKIPCRSVTHYCHADIEKDLGKKSWIFPWKSASVRSYGLYKAWQQGADIILTLDDDCYPNTPDFIAQYMQNLSTKLPVDWTPTYPFRDEMFTRGFPYLVREKIDVYLSHGLWSEVPDFDGMTQLMRNGKTYPELPAILHIIPKNMYYPMSAMNVCFRAEIAPLMYQLLMGFDKAGKKYDYDRFDDIWSGIFAKKVLDHLGYGVVSGTPFVRHERASNVFNNIKKEATGIEKNEILWQSVKKVKLKEKTVVGAYRELIEKVEFPDEPYFKDLKKAILTWLKLFT